MILFGDMNKCNMKLSIECVTPWNVPCKMMVISGHVGGTCLYAGGTAGSSCAMKAMPSWEGGGDGHSWPRWGSTTRGSEFAGFCGETMGFSRQTIGFSMETMGFSLWKPWDFLPNSARMSSTCYRG